MGDFIQQKASIEIIPFTDNLKEEWDRFIDEKAINSTFLHSRKFFDHNPLNQLDDSSLIFYKESKIIAVLPAVLYKVDGSQIFHSHLRATYGGFIVSKKVGVEEAIEVVELTIAFARDKGAKQIIIRNPFRIFNQNLCDETDYAMWFHGFEIKSRELEMAIPLTGELEKIKSEYHKGTRYSLGKSRKDVKVCVCEDFEKFWTLLEKNLWERFGHTPVHDISSIKTLRENVGHDKVLLFGAYFGDRLIGGNVLFNFHNKFLHGQYNAADNDYLHLAPVHAIVNYILEWGNKRGFEYFNMGMSNEEEGKKINIGLCRWKESFGARGVLRETMSLYL